MATTFIAIPQLPHTSRPDERAVRFALARLSEIEDPGKIVRDAREALESVGGGCLHEVLRVESERIVCANVNCRAEWKRG